MDKRFNQYLKQALIGPVLTMFGLLVVLLALIFYLLNSAKWVDHPHQVLGQIFQVEKLAVDMETGLRGYRLTGDPIFLEPFDRATLVFPKELSALQTLVRDNPAQSAAVLQLRESHRIWYDFATNMRQRAASSLPVDNALQMRGKVLMDALRANVDTLQTHEEHLLVKRARAVAQVRKMALASLVFLGILFAPLLFFVMHRAFTYLGTAHGSALIAAERDRQRVADVLESITDGFCVIDASGQLTQFNSAAKKMLAGQAIQAEALLGKSLLGEAFSEARDLAVGRATQRTLTERVPTEAESFYEPWQRWFNLRNYPTPDGGVATFFQDITERKQAEEMLRESEENFRNFVGQVKDYAIFRMDLAGRATTWNEGVRNVLGFDASEFIGLDLVEKIFTPEDVASGVAENRLRTAAREGTASDDRWMQRKNGERFFARGVTTALRNQAGEVIGFTKVLRDSTPQKQAEDALRESREQLAKDLAATEQLQRISAELILKDNVEVVYENILDAAVAIMHADFGSMQMFYPKRGAGGELRLLTSRGFSPEAAKCWEWVRPESGTTCSMALRTGHRCTVPDVEQCEFMVGTEDLAAYRQTGIRAVQTTPLLSRSGKILGMISTHWREPREPSPREFSVLDVLAWETAEVIERKAAEKSLRASEERFRAAVNSVTSIIWTNNARGEMEGEQLGWGRFTGQPPEEYQGYGWAKAVHPEDAQPTIDGWNQAVAEKRRFEGEHRVRRHDGEWRLCSIRAVPVLGETGEIREWVGVHTDITEPKRVEAALRESEERMRLATEATEVGIWERNVLTNAIRWDAQMFRIYGRTPTPDGIVAYTDWRGAVLPEDLAETEAILQDTVRRLGQSTRRFRILRADNGECRWIQAVETVRANAAGQAERVIGTNLDVTEQQNTERAIREATEKAVAANVAKDRFLAALSHELRTPLTPVLLVSDVRARSKKLSEDLREDFAMIYRNIVLEAQLIDDLLDISCIQPGKMRFDFMPVDVHEAIARSIEMLRSEVEEKGIAVRQELRATPPVIEADPARVQQVLCNLLRNAVKFTPRGGTITVGTACEFEELQISVADTGAGIAAEDLGRIFHPFEQVDAQQKSEHRSLGLGLAISAAIVTAHRGRIWAESPGPGQGATFHVRLPF